MINVKIIENEIVSDCVSIIKSSSASPLDYLNQMDLYLILKSFNISDEDVNLFDVNRINGKIFNNFFN